MFSRTSSEALVGAGTVVIGLGALWLANTIPAGNDDGVGPRLVPLALAVLTFVLGVVHVATNVAMSRSVAIDDGRQASADSSRAPAAIIAIGAIYIALISALGYLLATALVLPALLITFGTARPLDLAVHAIAGAVAYQMIFVRYLGLSDTPGWLIDVPQVLGL